MAGLSRLPEGHAPGVCPTPGFGVAAWMVTRGREAIRSQGFIVAVCPDDRPKCGTACAKVRWKRAAGSEPAYPKCMLYLPGPY